MKKHDEKYYHFSQFELNKDKEFPVWMPPEGTIGMIDFRNYEECSRKSGLPDTGAYGLFVTNKKLVDTGIFLGQNLDARVKKKEKVVLEKKLGIRKGDISGVTIADIIGQLLTEQADPTGVDRWKPLMSRCVALCDCPDIWTGDFQKSTIWKKLFIAAKQQDFRCVYQDLLDGKCHEDHPGMVLDYWSKRHGVEPQFFVPSDIPRQDIKPHKTIIGDTFEGADGTSILAHTATGPNGGFGWSAINGTAQINSIVSGPNAGESVLRTSSAGFTENNFRSDGVISGDDHYSEAAFTYSAGGNHDLRLYTRFDAATWTGYLILAIRTDSSNTQLFKVVNGTGTLINNYSDAPGAPSQRAYRLESDGSTHTPTVGGVVFAAQTDTTITGNLRGGLGGRGGGTEIDNYVFADLVSTVIESIDSPVTDGETDNMFRVSGFSGDVSSATIETVGESYSTALSINNAIKNGKFNDGIADWDPLNAVLTIATGALRVTSIVGGVANAQQVMSGLEIGQSYTVRCDYVTDAITGSFLMKVGTSPGSTDTGFALASSPGPVEVTFTATLSTHYLSLGTTSAMTAGEFFDVDNVTLDNNFAFDMPDVAGFIVDTSGAPFDSASHNHTFTASYLAENASVPIVVNPKSGWQVVDVVSAVTTPGSVFEGFGATPVDGDQVYWPTANATSVAADGTLTTGQVGGTIGMLLFNTVVAEWQPFDVAVSGSPPGTGKGVMSLLGVG